LLDIDELLTPIPGDNPAGIDLRSDSSPSSIYYAVKDARTAARSSERQLLLEGDGSAPPPDWRPVLERGCEALKDKSKDLEIAAFVVEAALRLDGLAGLRDGFRLLRELIERFWDQLYPLPDEDGVETRVAPIAGLNGSGAEGTLLAPLARIRLTEGSSDGPFS